MLGLKFNKRPYHSWYIELIQISEIIRGLKDALIEARKQPLEDRTEEDIENLIQIEVEISKFETSKSTVYNERHYPSIFMLSTSVIFLYIWSRGLDRKNLNPTNVRDIT